MFLLARSELATITRVVTQRYREESGTYDADYLSQIDSEWKLYETKRGESALSASKK